VHATCTSGFSVFCACRRNWDIGAFSGKSGPSRLIPGTSAEPPPLALAGDLRTHLPEAEGTLQSNRDLCSPPIISHLPLSGLGIKNEETIDNRVGSPSWKLLGLLFHASRRRARPPLLPTINLPLSPLAEFLASYTAHEPLPARSLIAFDFSLQSFRGISTLQGVKRELARSQRVIFPGSDKNQPFLRAPGSRSGARSGARSSKLIPRMVALVSAFGYCAVSLNQVKVLRADRQARTCARPLIRRANAQLRSYL